MFLEETFLKKEEKHTSSAMLSTNKSNVLNKGRVFPKHGLLRFRG
jgi:hypothetical protein